MRWRSILLMGLALVTATGAEAQSGRLRERIAARMAQRQASTPVVLPADVEALRDLPYGPSPAQKLDVYRPKVAHGAPIVVMAHGGGWKHGDKSMDRVVDNKVAWLTGQGLIFVSINYRMLPDADVKAQANDVARALATVQAKAADWGGDPTRVVLMGHSAGAHLVALLAADPAWASAQGARPWRGTITLDSAAMDVPAIMTSRHLRLYDEAFGDDPKIWTTLSPLQRMKTTPTPLFMVCSSRRSDACPQAQALADKARSLGGQATVLAQDRSHGAINADLGEPGAYSDAVAAFLREVTR